ncbi:ELM1/GtrOC1 family putative glycosyltransferase [Ancylobacter amanitiformis]|uniref:Mitochondrial fission protein ELM1 n=1 Tax=Ancylobacter amanitiformis TaxID=217069 RepID=A0ABU0LLH0_9HYPH|nr:ELM1/GtrOC1 family putative glycosyltransferase [Ancylobacter amanitiformis]MDQ0509547.1 mitochondrial fission protein ELM1 [Ancylobacter amanitiformis]
MKRVLILRDAKPGHFHQAEGLALAIARLTPVEVSRLEVRPARFASSDMRKLVMRRFGRDARFWLRWMYALDLDALTRPDVIVASGWPTIACGLLLSRHFRVPFIFAGALDGYEPGPLTLTIVSSPRQAGDPGAAYAPIPSTIDREAYAAPRPLRRPEDLRGASLALLIGGSAYRREFPRDEWEALLAFVPAVTARFGVRWRVANSRRTPEAVSDRFKALAQAGTLAEFLDYRDAGAGSVRDLFGADAVVVTEDSMSMLAEGLAAGRPVIALKSRLVHKHYANEVIVGMAGPHLAILPMATITPDPFAATLARLVPPPENARDLLARAIAPMLGLTFPENAS